MKRTYKYFLRLKTILLACIICLSANVATAQQNIIVNLSAIDGLDLTPDNTFNFQVQSFMKGNTSAVIKGVVRYRNSPLTFSYTAQCTLRPGTNMINADFLHPSWQFSSGSLRELFFNYKTLPSGTYEYCVSVLPNAKVGDSPSGIDPDECLYHKAQDLFLLNLVDPEDNAKIHEYNPALSWVANCPFVSQLTYRVRVADVKQGQNAANAITRNNPVYDENNLVQNSIVYPVYAKPLVKNQLYAWTVDAYFKGILLGGSEIWRFTIIDDTINQGLPGNRSFVDIKREDGTQQLFALGDLKLKYILDDAKIDSLHLFLYNDQNATVLVKPSTFNAVYGDNRYVLNLKDSCSLKDNSIYLLDIKTNTKHEYKIPFKYQNPDLH